MLNHLPIPRTINHFLLILVFIVSCSQDETEKVALQHNNAKENSQEAKSVIDDEIILADSLLAKAIELNARVQYDSANNYFEQASAIYEKMGAKLDEKQIWIKLTGCYNAIGYNKVLTAEFETARTYISRALEFGINKLGRLHQRVAESYNILGLVHFYSGDYDQTIDYFKKALEIRRQLLGDEHFEVAQSYNNIAQIYYHQNGDLDRALEYLGRALALYQKLPQRDAEAEAKIYNNLGLVYADKEEFDQALGYHTKSLNLKLQKPPRSNPDDIAESYHNIGTTHSLKHDYDPALRNMSKALAIYKSLYRKNHPHIIQSYLSLGNIYLGKGEYDQAIASYETALSLAHEAFGPHHPRVAAVHQGLGSVYTKQTKFQKAFRHFQKALAALVPGFDGTAIDTNPPLRDNLSEKDLLTILQSKGEALALFAHSTDDHALKINNYELSLSTYELGLALIDTMRMSYKAEGSKFFLEKKTFPIYEKSIQTARTLYDLTQDKEYKEKAFEYSERGKANILWESLQESKARRFAGIPDSLLAKERRLRIDLTRYNGQIQQERLKQAGHDSSTLDTLKSLFFSVKQRYETFLGTLEKRYPRYYELKYEPRGFSLNDIQAILDERTIVLEYFTGIDSIYTFILTPTELTVTAVKNDSTIERLANSFRDVIGGDSGYPKFVNPAHRLYEYLIEPIEEQIAGKQLIIIPDGFLNALPFEALLTKAVPAQPDFYDYRPLPYLINEYTISYAYSAALLLDTTDEAPPLPEKDFIAYAPIFRNGLPDSSIAAVLLAQLNSRDPTRGVAEPLLHSEEEVTGIDSVFKSNYNWLTKLGNGLFAPKTRVRLERQATEQNLAADDLQNYRYVHLSTHGFLYKTDPELSGLIFYPPDRESEDGVLLLREVYNLSLNADLLSLSACETGLGAYYRGEGLIGLSRGFIYAGARNLLVSLWRVNDESTSRLMVDFYGKMLDMQNKAEALRAAKLEMIQASEEFAHPYHWAPFILIGK